MLGNRNRLPAGRARDRSRLLLGPVPRDPWWAGEPAPQGFRRPVKELPFTPAPPPAPEPVEPAWFQSGEQHLYAASGVSSASEPALLSHYQSGAQSRKLLVSDTIDTVVAPSAGGVIGWGVGGGYSWCAAFIVGGVELYRWDVTTQSWTLMHTEMAGDFSALHMGAFLCDDAGRPVLVWGSAPQTITDLGGGVYEHSYAVTVTAQPIDFDGTPLTPVTATCTAVRNTSAAYGQDALVRGAVLSGQSVHVATDFFCFVLDLQTATMVRAEATWSLIGAVTAPTVYPAGDGTLLRVQSGNPFDGDPTAWGEIGPDGVAYTWDQGLVTDGATSSWPSVTSVLPVSSTRRLLLGYYHTSAGYRTYVWDWTPAGTTVLLDGGYTNPTPMNAGLFWGALSDDLSQVVVWPDRFLSGFSGTNLDRIHTLTL